MTCRIVERELRGGGRIVLITTPWNLRERVLLTVFVLEVLLLLCLPALALVS